MKEEQLMDTMTDMILESTEEDLRAALGDDEYGRLAREGRRSGSGSV